MTQPLGRLQRGELRPARPAAAGWRRADHPEQLFRAPWLREKLRGAEGALTGEAGGCRLVALPFGPDRPFPLTALFCLARICRINGETYAVFAFDRGENPVPWGGGPPAGG